MQELKGIAYLRARLAAKQPRIKTRYQYYEMKNIARDYSRMMPSEFSWLSECLGWCAKCVDSIADRLAFNEFKYDDYDINTIYQMNNPDILFDSAMLGALISSCSFIYISEAEDGFPRLQVIDGYNATGRMDPITGLLYEGYAVLERDSNDMPTLEAYFAPGYTMFMPKGMKTYKVKNAAPSPLLVPILYRPDAIRPFGHSRISRACMNIMDGAIRTLKRSEVSAEFYSFPQKYVLGLEEDAEFNKKAASISSFLAFYKDSDGDKPQVGQFSQQSMAPYIDQIRMFAALFAGETGLSLDDLGFPSDNPSSAEAIKASHENLRLVTRKAQKTFGTGFLNAGYLAATVRDECAYERGEMYLTTPSWEPIFEPDSSMIGAMCDGILKLQQAMPDYITRDKIHELTGL